VGDLILRSEVSVSYGGSTPTWVVSGYEHVSDGVTFYPIGGEYTAWSPRPNGGMQSTLDSFGNQLTVTRRWRRDVSEYSATIDWGDGRTSAGVLQGRPGYFGSGMFMQAEVHGDHTYHHVGADDVTVTVHGPGLYETFMNSQAMPTLGTYHNGTTDPFID